MANYKKELKTMPIASLTENPKNPNMHPNEQIKDIARSIEEYGQYYPIIVDESGVILAGHGKKRALELLGRTEAECLVMTGLTDKQKMKLLLSDNKIQSFSFLKLTLEEDLIKAIDDTDIIGYNPEFLADILGNIQYDNTGMELAKSEAQYADEAQQMNTPQEAQVESVSQEEGGNTTPEAKAAKVADDDPMASFTAKHTIICPHCGKPIEL